MFISDDISRKDRKFLSFIWRCRGKSSSLQREIKYSKKWDQLINEFIDVHIEELNDLWDKAQRGETIKKIQ